MIKSQNSKETVGLNQSAKGEEGPRDDVMTSESGYG